jgi:hypothetical protein
MLSVADKPFTLNAIQLSVIMLNAIMLNDIMLNAIMLSVVVPFGPYDNTDGQK